MKKIYNALLILNLALLSSTGITAQPDRGVANRQTQKRVALVIGNGAYQKTEPLANPVNDAADMKAALEALGFEVIYGVNRTKEEMRLLIRQFGEKLNETNGVGLVFYAGHGLAAGGENYLVPVDAEIPREDEIEGATIPLNFLMGKLDTAKNPLNIVILDACRNNPFAGSWGGIRDASSSGGLVIPKQAPTGTLIAFATAPGQTVFDGTGRNGLYTQELLQQIRQPNQKLEDVFKNVRSSVLGKSNGAQAPWESSVTGDFYFAGGGAQLAAEPIPATGEGGSSRGAEDVMWETIVSFKSRVAVEGYLSEYPSGKYAASARSLLKEFEAEELKATRDMDQQKWGDAERSNTIQSYRTYLSLYPNGVFKETADQRINDLTAKAEALKPAKGKTVKNSLGMEFMGVPAGTFMMGSPPNEKGRNKSETQHQVTLTNGFWMGKYEVTNLQWQDVMGTLPVQCHLAPLTLDDNVPVVCVSWLDVQKFINKLNARGVGTYRLPTEAEWEYACRAETTTAYYWGDDKKSMNDYARVGAGFGFVLLDEKNTPKKTRIRPVGEKRPNNFGLFDMSGNVYEWVSDLGGEYPSEAVTGPQGPPSGSGRVFRGGYYDSSSGDVRSAARGFYPNESTGRTTTGFRLVKVN